MNPGTESHVTSAAAAFLVSWVPAKQDLFVLAIVDRSSAPPRLKRTAANRLRILTFASIRGIRGQVFMRL